MSSGSDAAAIDKRINRSLELRANLGRLTFREIKKSTDDEGWQVSVMTESGDPATLTFYIDPNPPNKFIGMRIEVGD